MSNTHDIKAAFIDLRDNYERSGWVDSGIEQSIKQMGEALGVCEDESTLRVVVRLIVSDCVWLDPDADPDKTRWMERDATERLMRLVKH